MSATVDQTAREHLVDGLIRVLETGRGASEVFASDAIFDLNVPAWRFQVQGPDAFNEWWHEEVQGAGRVTIGRSARTPSGFVVETAIEFTYNGEELYARQVLLCEVVGDRIVDVVLYCTGDWDADTRARQAAEAPMIRP